jgi:hypothetical protein
MNDGAGSTYRAWLPMRPVCSRPLTSGPGAEPTGRRFADMTDSITRRRVLRAPGRLALSAAITIVFGLISASILASGLEHAHLSGVAASSVVAATTIPAALLCVAVPATFGLSRVVVDSDGIDVRNWGTQRTRLRWQEISYFSVGPSWFAPAVGIAVRHDGSVVVMAATSPVGPRAWSARESALAAQPMIDYLTERLRAARVAATAA